MSWISENYEKAAVGVAVVAAAGLAYAGFSKLSSVEEEFSSTPKGPPAKSDPGVKSAGLVAKANSSFQIKREWTQGDHKGRPVDLFTGIALFVNKNDLKNPVDIETSPPVHEGIPNDWWIQNRIDPGFGDSPLRDKDEDGFSNKEEVIAKTDPNNKSEYPPLITKLAYIGDESVQWVLRPGFESEGGAFTFNFGDGKVANKVGAANPVAPGGLFFENDPYKGRFKLLGSEKKTERNEATQSDMPVTIVRVEDQKPNKKGTVYEIPASFRQADQRKYSHFDRTAVLSLEALGLNGQEIRVEENTTFALPPGDTKPAYKIKEVTPEHVVVEFTGEDGKVQSHEIAKGATGPVTP